MKFISLLLILLLSSCATTKTTWAYGRGDSGYIRYMEPGLPSKIISQTSSKIDTAHITLMVELIEQSKENIPFATVVLYKNNTQVAGGTTDIDGQVTFKQLTPGEYKIKAVFVGYNPASGSIIIENGRAYKIKIELGYSGQLTY